MASILETFAPGAVVADRYRIDALLGQGGFGAVFRATEIGRDATGRSVALKVLVPDALRDEGLPRFQREAAIVQRLEHPNVVRLLDFGIAHGVEPYLVFELLEGQTLDAAIRASGAMPAPRVVRITSQILKALMEAHARGIVHRDIKPANVFLCSFQGEPDFVKLLDFGIAKGEDTRPLTQRGAVIGTPAYMAPEQVTGAPITFAADLFALGLVMEEALTGEPVFKDASLVDIVREHVSPNAVPHVAAALRSSLGPVLHRATQKDPARRYPSASEMLAHVDAIASYAGGELGRVSREPSALPSAPPSLASAPTALPALPVLGAASPLVPPPPASRRPVFRKPTSARGVRASTVAGAAGALLLVVGVIVATAMRGSEEKPRGSTAPAVDVRSTTTIAWARLEPDNTLVETDVNGDRTPDFVGLCDAEAGGSPDLCAVNGATFELVWRKPMAASSAPRLLAGASRNLVWIDDSGVAHVLDASTGNEAGAVRLGARARWMCAPPDAPGKVWIRTAAPRGLFIDTRTRAVSNAARPASCLRGHTEQDCWENTNKDLCPPNLAEVKIAGFGRDAHEVEGGRGVMLLHKNNDLAFGLLAGFEPASGASGRDARVFWQRSVAPGDGLGGSVSGHMWDFALAGGRAFAGYDLPAGDSRIVAVDGATGRTLWESPSRTFRGLVATATRVYTRRRDRLDVRDASTGTVIGGIGREEER